MNTQTQTLQNAEKFQNAEQLWFWFIYSRAVRNGILKTGGRATRRVCELVDVESQITKLYLCGKITDEQLSVMKKFGDKHRAPHQYIWAENRAADQWRSAMTTLGDAAYSHGWIEQ
jgi:hypothetical protein